MTKRSLPSWALPPPEALPRLSAICAATGKSFAVERARLGGIARAKKASKRRLSAIGRKGGLASMKARTPEERAAWASKWAKVGNQVRWGT